MEKNVTYVFLTSRAMTLVVRVAREACHMFEYDERSFLAISNCKFSLYLTLFRDRIKKHVEIPILRLFSKPKGPYLGKYYLHPSLNRFYVTSWRRFDSSNRIRLPTPKGSKTCSSNRPRQDSIFAVRTRIYMLYVMEVTGITMKGDH